jgi:hypothetical protein
MLRDVAWTGNQFVAVGDNGVILSSLNGKEWIVCNSGVTSTIRAVISADTLLYAVGDSGIILVSKGGTEWTPLPTGTINDLYDIAQTDASYIAVGAGIVLTSTDGRAWSAHPLGSVDTLSSIANAKGLLVAAGYNRALYTSDSGKIWQLQSSGYLDWLYGTIIFKGKILAAGYNYSAYNCYGTVLSSSNGVNWTRAFSGSTKEVLYGIDTDDSMLIAVGYQGTILISTDAQIWLPCTSGTTRNLMSVTHSSTQFVAVGARGVILCSEKALLSGTQSVQKESAIQPFDITGITLTSNTLLFSIANNIGGPVDIWLLDLTGHVVFGKKGISSNRVQFNLKSKVSSGSYVFVLKSKKKRFETSINLF